MAGIPRVLIPSNKGVSAFGDDIVKKHYFGINIVTQEYNGDLHLSNEIGDIVKFMLYSERVLEETESPDKKAVMIVHGNIIIMEKELNLLILKTFIKREKK